MIINHMNDKYIGEPSNTCLSKKEEQNYRKAEAFKKLQRPFTQLSVTELIVVPVYCILIVLAAPVGSFILGTKITYFDFQRQITS
jgi:hypothetical protein